MPSVCKGPDHDFACGIDSSYSLSDGGPRLQGGEGTLQGIDGNDNFHENSFRSAEKGDSPGNRRFPETGSACGGEWAWERLLYNYENRIADLARMHYISYNKLRIYTGRILFTIIRSAVNGGRGARKAEL
mgnify:CR=1 FL=1